MTLTVTLVLMAATAAFFALAAWRSGRPADPARVRMIPWTLVCVLTAVFFMLLLAHLFSLFGLEPGQRFMPR